MRGPRWQDIISDDKRFWLKIWPRGDCWEWRGYLNAGTGYGRFSVGGKPTNAYRFAYEQAKGAIPPGLTIDHLCRHRWCVKPSHLEAVTQAVNMKRGWNYNRIKQCCPKCGGPFTTQTIRSGANEGKTMRFCTPCKRIYCRAWKARVA